METLLTIDLSTRGGRTAISQLNYIFESELTENHKKKLVSDICTQFMFNEDIATALVERRKIFEVAKLAIKKLSQGGQQKPKSKLDKSDPLMDAITTNEAETKQKQTIIPTHVDTSSCSNAHKGLHRYTVKTLASAYAITFHQAKRLVQGKYGIENQPLKSPRQPSDTGKSIYYADPKLTEKIARAKSSMKRSPSRS